MENFDIFSLKHGSRVHFIGIGGISMSGLAEMMAHHDYIVSGSDAKSSGITQKLISDGLKVSIGHNPSNVEGSDLVVYTAAVKFDNPEMIRAKELNIPIIERATLLGELMKKYNYSIGISGTHGKTTTTSMISLILLEANADPTITVGGELNAIGGNLRLGNSEFFVAEACEYYDSFLKFNPYVGVILNIDADHLDYFKDIEQITDSFTKYAKRIPNNGYLVANIDDSKVKKVAENAGCNVVTYALNDENADYIAGNVEFNSNGFANFNVYQKGKLLGEVSLNIPGIHNVYNSLAAIAACMSLGVEFNYCQEGLSKFYGAKRRFEKKGIIANNVTVIDDYAHHPSEIMATLKAAQNYPHNRVWCVFQPHTYSRTKTLLNEFIEAFDNADKLILADTYVPVARNEDSSEVDLGNIVAKIKERGVDAVFIKEFVQIQQHLLENLASDDVIITMGAGDIYKVGENLINEDSKHKIESSIVHI